MNGVQHRINSHLKLCAKESSQPSSHTTGGAGTRQVGDFSPKDCFTTRAKWERLLSSRCTIWGSAPFEATKYCRRAMDTAQRIINIAHGDHLYLPQSGKYSAYIYL